MKYTGPERRLNGDRRKGFHKWRWRLITIWIAAFTGVSYWQWQSLQDSRVASCKQTYESYNKVFAPFEPKPLTKDWVRFKAVVAQLKLGCKDQVTPEP